MRLFLRFVSPALIFLDFGESSSYGILPGFIKWISKLYRNQGNLIFAPKPMDWDEQIVVVTGGEWQQHCAETQR